MDREPRDEPAVPARQVPDAVGASAVGAQDLPSLVELGQRGWKGRRGCWAVGEGAGRRDEGWGTASGELSRVELCEGGAAVSSCVGVCSGGGGNESGGGEGARLVFGSSEGYFGLELLGLSSEGPDRRRSCGEACLLRNGGLCGTIEMAGEQCRVVLGIRGADSGQSNLVDGTKSSNRPSLNGNSS